MSQLVLGRWEEVRYDHKDKTFSNLPDISGALMKDAIKLGENQLWFFGHQFILW